jgi:hypothetical protein
LTKFVLAVFALMPIIASAEPLAAPGDLRLRHDLELLNDVGIINVPMTAWPLALGDIHTAIQAADIEGGNAAERDALSRVRAHLAWELSVDEVRFQLGLGASANPRIIRSFEQTPREEGHASVAMSWMGDRFAMNLAATYAFNPFDGEEFRPDGTYVGVALGNWMLTAGWQERWWGPSRDGSLILGTNARPTPGISLQRNLSTPFRSKWLSWMGPWTLTTFMTVMDDERVINDAWLFGIRGSFRPPKTGLEIGISRAAQWCGDDRPCDVGIFLDLLVGNDNRGVNVDPEDEPGNQLGGFDIRWRLPAGIPAALYMQWAGDDGRGGGAAIGSWLRQVGAEYWGTLGGMSHRTHLEVSDSTCRQGGFGFSDMKPDCAYNHEIYQSGFRYRGRATGHPGDGDTLSYSFGSTLVQSAGRVWNLLIRHMEINRAGSPDRRHSLAPTPEKLIDIQASHDRVTKFGRFSAGIGYRRLEDEVTAKTSSDAIGFFQWRSN